MRTLHKILICGLLMAAPFGTAFAQGSEEEAIIKQGIQLHDQRNYAGAIEKYQEALKLNPKSTLAEFEMAFSMMASGRGTEAIPHLEIVAKDDAKLRVGALDMLGSIHDNDKQFDKAIDYFKKAIAADPKYQRTYYNMGVTYLRQQKYVEAEAAAIEALKLNPRHSSSHKLYGVAAYAQKRNVAALMAYCNFLMLEPQTPNTAVVYNTLQGILRANISAGGDNKTNISLPTGGDTDTNAGNLSISMAVLSATEGDKKNLPPVEQLQEQLKTIFMINGELSEKKANKDFFWKFYADYFYNLAKSPAMAGFTRIISLTGFQQDNLAWFKAHPEELKTLDEWNKANVHAF